MQPSWGGKEQTFRVKEDGLGRYQVFKEQRNAIRLDIESKVEVAHTVRTF